jgi:hypothetical protein
MIYFLGWIAFLILIFLSVIHFYWAVGGKWGFNSVLPTKNDGSLMMKPKWIDSITVGIGLAFIAMLYAIKIELVFVALPNWLSQYGMYIIASIFLIRAIGDFKYVGFFKSIKNTLFANNDNKYFSPLCLFLGVIAFLLEYFKS